MFKKIKTLLFDNISTGQTIFKNTFWLMFAEIISKGLGFFLTIWIARYLEAEGYGKFSFVFAFVALFAVLADFGLSTLTIREIARDKSKAKKYINNIAAIKLILGVITFSLIVLVAQFLGKTPEVRTLVYLAGICTVITSFIAFFQAVFRAFEKMQYQALSQIIYSISLFCIAGFVLWKHLEIKILVSSYVVAALISLIFTLILVWKKIGKFRFSFSSIFWKWLLKNCWPYGISGILARINFSADIVLLGILCTNKEVGFYSADYRIVNLLILLTSFIYIPVFPVLSRFFSQGKKKSLNEIGRTMTRLMSIIALPLGFGGSILARKIIVTLYGPAYTQASIAFSILIWSAVLIYLREIYGFSLSAFAKQKIYMNILIISASTNIVLNLILIPKFGILAAATTTLVSEFINLILMYIYTSKLMETQFFSSILRPAIAGFGMFLILYFFKDANLLLSLIIGVLVYFALLYIIKGIKREDFVKFKSILATKSIE